MLMESVVIARCLKRPGVFDRARTYRLEHNSKGLYLICLGPSTVETPAGKGSAAGALAHKILDKVAAKYEKEVQETEARLEKEGLDALAQTKKSHFIATDKVESFEHKPGANGVSMIDIKGGGVKMRLWVHSSYDSELDKIQLAFNK